MKKQHVFGETLQKAYAAVGQGETLQKAYATVGQGEALQEKNATAEKEK